MKKAVHQIFPIRGSRILLPRPIPSKLKSSIREFYIVLDEPHKIYHPGDEISGQIILILNENSKNLQINLSLYGSIKVSSNSPLRSDKKQELVNHSIVLYGDDNNNEIGLTIGEHRFPFIVKLPKKNIYTSIFFEKGEIKYILKSDLTDKSSSENFNKLYSSEKILHIIKPINLNLLPLPQPKILSFKNNSKAKNLINTLSSNSSINSSESLESSNDDIKIKMTIPSLGYLKGEIIPIKLGIKHYKKITNLNGIIITFIRICKLDLGQEYELQSFRKDLSQSITPLIVDPIKFTSEISTSLKIPPDSFPTIISNSLSFQYYIEVLINMSNSRINSTNNNKNQHEIVDDEIIQSNYNSNIFNVDNLKSMKNVLTLTSEIVIGTERKPISKLKKRVHKNRNSSNISNSTIVSPSNVSHDSSVSNSSPSSPSSINTSATPTNSLLLNKNKNRNKPKNKLKNNPCNNENINYPLLPSLPEDQSAIVSPVIESSNIIPSPSIQPPPFIDITNEKELLRLKEEALLPSEPPQINDTELSQHNVSLSFNSVNTSPSSIDEHEDIDHQFSNLSYRNNFTNSSNVLPTPTSDLNELLTDSSLYPQVPAYKEHEDNLSYLEKQNKHDKPDIPS